jgi:nucleoside-diphosphate-sugar epimerase
VGFFMRALVTGGGGFLGRAITEQLLARGDQVTILSRGRYPEVEALGARGVQCDLTAPAGLVDVIAGHDVVFHVASKTGVWGPREQFMDINVGGTKNLLAACRQAGVSRFVYTSSPSATFDGTDAENATEADCPYPDHFEADYPESKAAAEQLVLAADDEAMATTALRPHLIWGPRDPHIIPRLMQRRQQGRLARVGDGKNKVAITYIDNAAAAHLQAADALVPGSANAGKAYFISDEAPVVLWEWIDQLLVDVGLSPVSRSVSVGLAHRLGAVLEWTWRLFRLSGEPPMTRFVAAELAASHWYDLGAARKDFGYHPVIEPREAMDRTIAAFRLGQTAG